VYELVVGDRLKELKKLNGAYLVKNFRPSSPELFFIASHDLSTRASCSSVKTLASMFVTDMKEVVGVVACFYTEITSR